MVYEQVKPTLILAEQFKDDSSETLVRIYELLDCAKELRLSYKDPKNPILRIPDRHNELLEARIGDYIVKDNNGFHVSAATYFEAVYRPYETETEEEET